MTGNPDLPHHDVVIVGGGHAGAACAIALRKQGFEGSILVIGEEAELPYERPPLSKSYLAREKTFDRLLIRPETFWAEKHVEFRLGARVTAVDAGAKTVGLDEGSRVGYAHLVWAAGGTARHLTCDGSDLAGVHTVRCRTDVDRLMAELPDAERIVIVGAGYIGLEAAAVLSGFDKAVTVLEAESRVLARVAAPPISRFMEAEHRGQGVDIRLATTVDCLVGDGRVTGVRLADGETLPADLVIVGIGIVPVMEPLTDAGAEGTLGVDVDARCRTSLPDIYAIGDGAAHVNPHGDGSPGRIESVQNANDQAAVAAATICGKDVAYDALPWFWSDQYDLKLQTAGLNTGWETTITRGAPDTRSFSVAYFRGGRMVALDAVNAPLDFVAARKLLTDGVAVTADDVANEDVPLKSLIGRNP